MKVKYIGDTTSSLTNGKIYDVLAVENSLYRIVDNTGEDFLFWPEEFEIINDSDKKKSKKRLITAGKIAGAAATVAGAAFLIYRMANGDKIVHGFSKKWLAGASVDDLTAARNKVWEKYMDPKSNTDLRLNLRHVMNFIDNLIYEKQGGGANWRPPAPREGGWYGMNKD